jgi:pimeloyl-ACP methyl ester carboxylesterase
MAPPNTCTGAAGYHVLAPDQRGYGGSSRPKAVEDYNIVALTADLIGLLDDADAEHAAFVGHDWGAIVAWNMPLLHPDRVAAVAGLGGPPVPRSRKPPTQAWREMLGDTFFYILYFQEPGVADADLARDPATTMRRILAGARPPSEQDPAMLHPGPQGLIERLPEPRNLLHWVRQSELDHYTAEFSRTGFTGALNWYRNFDRNWEETADLEQRVYQPALMICAQRDPVLPPWMAAGMQKSVPNLTRTITIKNCGHWTQQEKPEEVNQALIEFLRL